MNCMICGCEIKTFGTGSENSDPNEFLHDAGFVTFDFGFGSKFDCEEYSGQIHDSCFETILNNVKQTRTLQQFSDEIKNILNQMENV